MTASLSDGFISLSHQTHSAHWEFMTITVLTTKLLKTDEAFDAGYLF